MLQKLLLLCMGCSIVVSLVFGGSDGRGNQNIQTQMDQPGQSVGSAKLTPDRIDLNARPAGGLGTYTTLSGFYDWQSNGGAVQNVQVNPANGNIHVTYMFATDSTSLAPTRVSGYAFSTDGGQTWDNFSNINVPSRSSGYPYLTVLKGPNAGLPAIANHSAISGTQSTVFIDSPEGTGAFAELNAPPTVALRGADQPIWPNIAGTADGSVVLTASINTGTVPPHFDLVTRTTDFASWSNWTQLPDSNSPGGRYPTHANDNGYVGILLNAGNAGGAWWHQSTDNGVTWSANAQNIYPTSPPGRDTPQGNCRIWVGNDFVWNGNIPLMTFGEQTLDAGRNNQGRIIFWSQATGFVEVADSSNTPGYNYPLNPTHPTQSNHLTMGWSTIGKSGNALVILFQALMRDTSAVGFNYGDIFYCRSDNNGVSWTTPVNLTNTTTLDERYPSISQWNEPGFLNVTWQEDTEPGSAAFTDLAPVSRARQVFYKFPIPTTSVDESDGGVSSFKLKQNYPNPFNPSTKIEYRIGETGPVSIKMYNTLGQEVATLLNENLSAGQYETTFSGANLPSGVYIYKMTAGSYSESKKMVLMK